MNAAGPLNRRARGFRRIGKDQSGQNLVEFALVMLLVLAILFGIIDFARALYAYEFVAHAAREGTRYASVRGSKCQLPGCPMSDAEAESQTQTYVKSLANGIGLDPTALANPDVSYPTQSYSSGACATSDNAPGCVVQVQVTYNFKFIFPFLPTITYPMSSTSQMIISQ